MTQPEGSSPVMWPLAGHAGYGDMAIDWRENVARRLVHDLRRHVAAAWYPRTVDPSGGFLCDFDARWADVGPHDRLLEFQARQTRTAARLGIAFPREAAAWREIALHGVRYIAERMEDREHGGWYTLVDRSGRPRLGGTKHAHGTAYLIGALVEAYRLTGDRYALETARRAFDWLDAVFHDRDHGGYFGWATREGQPILSPADLPAELAAHRSDPLGHGIGLKDANVHSDLLEALRLLVEVWPADIALARLAETYDVVAHRFATQSGSIHYLAHPNLTPIPGLELYGYVFQAAFRLPSAAAVCGSDLDDAWALALAMLRHGEAWAWDANRGGFLEAGPASEPSYLTGVDTYVRKHPWWVQAEAAKMLLLGALRTPAEGGHRELFDRLLTVVEREFVDHRHGGWESIPRHDVALRTRLGYGRLPKANIWKDASHEADMYFACIRMLRGLSWHDPID